MELDFTIDKAVDDRVVQCVHVSSFDGFGSNIKLTDLQKKIR